MSLDSKAFRLTADAIHAQLGFLEGEVLTIADSSFSDREQRKAAKDLLRQAFHRRNKYINELCGSGLQQTTTNGT